MVGGKACVYIIWDGEKMSKCGETDGVGSLWVSIDHRATHAYLCPEHRAFVVESVHPEAIHTSQGLMHVKTIKEIFKESSKKRVKKCPKCGHIF